MLSFIINWFTDRYDVITLAVCFLISTAYISNFISNNYKIYNQLSEDSAISRKIMFADGINQIDLSINTSEELVIFNKPALIEVKIEENEDSTKQLKLICNEQIVN